MQRRTPVPFNEDSPCNDTCPFLSTTMHGTLLLPPPLPLTRPTARGNAKATGSTWPVASHPLDQVPNTVIVTRNLAAAAEFTWKAQQLVVGPDVLGEHRHLVIPEQLQY